MYLQLNKSIDLPLEEQYRENWGWEDSLQRYEIDTEYQDKEYFENMDPEDLCYLVRKLDNFLMERGISNYFLHNYYDAIRAFNKIGEEDSKKYNDEC